MRPNLVIGLHAARYSGHARIVMRGVMRYIQEVPHLEIRDYRFSHRDLRFDDIPPWRGKVDGMILSCGNAPGAVEWLRKGDAPLVNVSGDLIGTGIVSVTTDYPALARLTVRHFTSLGHKHLAFIGIGTNGGSHLIEETMFDEAKTLDDTFWGLQLPTNPPETYDEDDMGSCELEVHIRDLLSNSPKPLAVVALNDRIALLLAKCARQLELAIPGELAIISLWDCESLQLCDPPITAVRADRERIGYMAAEMLHKMILGETISQEVFTVPPLEVIVRQSTIGAPKRPVTDVERALTYIREHACEGIQIKDVAQAVDMPRRTLEMEFKKHMGRTVGDAIQQVRLEHAKELLETTDLPTHQIAQMIGFTHYWSLNRLMAKATGMGSQEYRNSRRNGA